MPRDMTRDEIDDLLSEETVGRLGLIDDSIPYVVPISYAYRDGDVYAHSAPGRKLDALRAHPRICFEVDDAVSVDEWRSVIAWGTFEQLLGPEAREGLDYLLDRFRPPVASRGTEHPGAEMGCCAPWTSRAWPMRDASSGARVMRQRSSDSDWKRSPGARSCARERWPHGRRLRRLSFRLAGAGLGRATRQPPRWDPGRGGRA
ncbi:pyridoxamine 5'-phosphate oxidase family protein [Leifsonia sp. LS-T14]|uniref:pyridoxamine 5'-phosphate oxidase family protein n=1 Tax=unclassified Leifsonia TaxID=2663824 RepID=UPI0035A6A4F5